MRQQSELAFTTMLGDGQKAKSFLDELQGFAARTPFEFPDLVRSSQRLLAMGFSAESILPTLTNLGDAAAGLASGNEGLGRMTTALGQMLAKGKVSGEEMRQFAEAGVPAWKYLAETLGVTIPEAMKMSEKGLITGAVGVKAITAGMGKDFGGLMEKQSHTFGGLLSTIKDTFAIVSGQVMKPFFEQAVKMMQGLADFMGTPAFAAGLQTFMDMIGGVFGIIKDILSVVTGVDPAAGGALKNLFGPEVAGIFMQAVSHIREGLTVVFEALGKLFTFLGSDNPMAVFIRTIAGAAVIGAIHAIGLAFEIIGKIIEILIITFTNMGTAWTTIQTATTAGVKFWQDAFAAAGQLVQDVFTTVGKFFDDLGTGVTAVFDSMKGMIASWIGTITTNVRNFVDSALAIWKMFTENPPRMIGIMVGLVIGFFLNLAKGIGDFTVMAWNMITKWVDDTKTSIFNFFTALPGQVGEWLGDLLRRIALFTVNALSTMTDWVHDMFYNVVVEFFATLPGKVWAYLSELVGNFQKMGTESTAAVTTMKDDMWETISSFFSTLPSKMWDFAVDAVRGLINGFGSMVGTVKSAVSNFFGGIVDGIKKSLGIGSPSKVFMGIGKNMMQGLEAGLKRDVDLGGLTALMDTPSFNIRREFAIDLRSSDGSVNALTLSQMEKVAREMFGTVISDTERELRGGIA